MVIDTFAFQRKIEGAENSAPSWVISVQYFHQSAAAEGNRLARLDMLGSVADDAVYVRVVGRNDPSTPFGWICTLSVLRSP